MLPPLVSLFSHRAQPLLEMKTEYILEDTVGGTPGCWLALGAHLFGAALSQRDLSLQFSQSFDWTIMASGYLHPSASAFSLPSSTHSSRPGPCSTSSTTALLLITLDICFLSFCFEDLKWTSYAFSRLSSLTKAHKDGITACFSL